VKQAVPSILALLGAAILQVGVAPHLAIGGVVPNFVLLVVVTLALVLCVVGYVTGMLQERLFAEGWLLPVTVVFAASLFTALGYWAVSSIAGEGGAFGATVLRIVLPSAIYNTVLAVLVYPWLARLLRREPAVETVRQFR
jgi:cell shape-determining protein MreD